MFAPNTPNWRAWVNLFSGLWEHWPFEWPPD